MVRNTVAERIDVLWVEPDPVASSRERRAIEAAGARCWLAADAVSAEGVFQERDVETLVLGPSLPTGAARSIAEALAGDGDIRVVRLSERDPSAARLGAIRATCLGFLPLSSDGIVAACLSQSGDLPLTDAVAAAGVSSLAGGLDDAMRDACRRLRRAFHADACAIFTHVPTGGWVAGFEGTLSDDDLEELRERALASARGATTVMAASVLTRHHGGFESWLGARIITDDNMRVGLIALVHGGSRVYSEREHALLDVVGRRFAVELSWRGVHDHMLAELDAMREAGGLDPLLGVWSEATLFRLLDMMIASAKRTGSPLTVAVIDIMDLNGINEQWGHDAGDAVLRHMAELAVYAVRAYDVVARYRGGIAVVFNGTGIEDAIRVVRRVQRMFSAEDFAVDRELSIHVETRAGVAAMRGDDDDAEQLMRRSAAAAREARGQTDRIWSTTIEPAQSASDPAPSEGLRGLTLGGMYRLLHQIGSGGGGGVYRGEDLGLSRPVAIKVLNPELAQSGKGLDRFRQEASILAALRHPNLVQIYAFGVDAGFAYFVMELVEGESVEAAIMRYGRERARFPLSDVARITKQIAFALDTLHGSGVVHRDVKPANILLDPFRDRSVLVDVGIARRTGSDAYVAGTPPYMAPEVFANKDVGPRADVFGLAATVYEMLVLERPWPDVPDLFEMVAMKRTTPPTPLSYHRPELEGLDPVLMRGLHPDHSKRYPTVLEFAAALREGLQSLSDDSLEDSVDEPASVEQRRRARITGGGWRASRESDEAMTRVVVFRAIARVLGARKLAGWRVQLARRAPSVAEALSPSKPPLGWYPTATLHEILSAPDIPGGRSPEDLGLELGRASLRATFRRFFPASPATLTPRSTLTSLKQIWSHYHTWGDLEVVVRSATSAMVSITRTPRSKPVCAWISGMLEQLVHLSGGSDCLIAKLECEARGGQTCRFELTWK